MPIAVIAIACLGLAGIILGVVALRGNWQFVKAKPNQVRNRTWLAVALVLGVVLDGASWPLTYWMGYPIHVEAEPGRVVGIPFFVAYFDSAGRDYVGPLTMPGVIANSLFWFAVPQIFLYAFNRRRKEEHEAASA